jgi:hypothetical protein
VMAFLGHKAVRTTFFFFSPGPIIVILLFP